MTLLISLLLVFSAYGLLSLNILKEIYKKQFEEQQEKQIKSEKIRIIEKKIHQTINEINKLNLQISDQKENNIFLQEKTEKDLVAFQETTKLEFHKEKIKMSEVLGQKHKEDFINLGLEDMIIKKLMENL